MVRQASSAIRTRRSASFCGMAAGHTGIEPRSSAEPISHLPAYVRMGQAPSGMRLKSISAIGSTRLPTKPTLNSRPPMYSWTSTSSTMTEQFDEVLVQEYIGGREFNVGFVGSRVLPIAEIDFSRMPEGAWPILTYAGKWEIGSADDLGSMPVCPAAIPQKLADRLVRIAELAWRTMQGKGYGRVDLRVDDQGRPWVLEVNPNPDLNDDAGLSRMSKVAGWDYAELVRRIAEVALREAQGAKAARELLAPSRRPRATRTA